MPFGEFKTIFIKGLPLMLNELFWAAGMTTVTQCYSVRGLSVIAGLNIATTITNLFNIVFIQLGACISIVVGQYLGAGELEKAKDADGFVFGTPVHYAAASGNMTAFMDRLFYSAPKETFCRKPAAVITSARRAGTTAAYEQLLKYPGITEMPIVSSCYWNNVHGSKAEDVQQDEEGVRIMRVLGHNMAWLLRCIEAGKAAGVPNPRKEPLAKTNFIR